MEPAKQLRPAGGGGRIKERIRALQSMLSSSVSGHISPSFGMFNL